LPNRLLTRRDVLKRGLALGSGVLLLAGCSVPDRQSAPLDVGSPTTTAPVATTPRRGGVVRIGRPGDIVPAGAPFVLTAANVHLFTLLYDTLVSYNSGPASDTPRPRLATRWEWTADARRLTLSLRPGVKFHTGRPLTSDDVKFNLEHLREPAVGSQWRAYANAMHISTPDPLTVVIDYDAPLKSSFDVLAATFIADPQTLDQVNSGKGFVGTGPFKFREWLPGDHLTVDRNPDYWQPGKPYLDQVELHITPDAQTALVALESGALEWMSGVPAQDARRLQADPNYQVMLTASGGTFHYLGLDLAFPPLADRRVRQAFNYALNRQRMVDAALTGFGRATPLVWPRESLGYDATQDQSYAFDLAKARQLLEAASWNADTLVPLAYGALVTLSAPMAQIYQADLASIGVKLDVQAVPNADFFSRLQTAGFNSAWTTTMAFMQLSPATFLSGAFPVRVPNASHFESDRYSQLIALTNTDTDDQTLKTHLHELTQIMLDESFIAPIAESAAATTGPEVARATVHNAAWNRFGLFAYEDIWLAPPAP
jgi:peptide/nickel transport system substrate-binding protein